MKISVIITVLNGEKYLGKAVDSFLAQDYPDKELIIIDGKSTDFTHQIIVSYQQKNPDSIIWIKEIDSGISNARNIALRHIAGNVVGFLGADDILHKNFFKEMAYHAKINPDFDVMYFDGYGIAHKGNSSFRLASNVNFTKRNLIKCPPITSGECFYYKKQIFEEFSFNEKNKYSMDYEMSMALVCAHKKFYGVAIPAVFNISDGENVSCFLSDKQRAETMAVQLKYAECLIEKIRIILRRPKFILKNCCQILQSLRSL